MTKTLTIKKAENKGFTILRALQVLYMDGTEINKLEDIGRFMDDYHEKGEMVMMINEEALLFFKECFKNESLEYHVQELPVTYYKYGLRPIYEVEYPANLRRYYAYHWETGDFKEDETYRRKIFHDLSGDAEEVSHEEFVEYVKGLREKLV